MQDPNRPETFRQTLDRMHPYPKGLVTTLHQATSHSCKQWMCAKTTNQNKLAGAGWVQISLLAYFHDAEWRINQLTKTCQDHVFSFIFSLNAVYHQAN